jgi:hypothetical protein
VSVDRTETAIRFAGEAERAVATTLDSFCAEFTPRKLVDMKEELEQVIRADPDGGDPFYRRLLRAVETDLRRRGRRE